jgi:very-short-patch-repair endonuclease
MPAKKYFLITKICPFCHSEFETFDGGQNAREYCSKSCAMKDRKLSEENKKKISNSLTKWNKENNTNPDYICKYDQEIKKCLECGKDFEVYNKKLEFCSKICSNKHHKHSSKTKEIMSKVHKIRYEQGLAIGWKPRSSPSFPETIAASILDKHNFNYVKEFPIKRWLIDFADIDHKIALEIDGKQHDRPDRKITDNNKDRYLISNGWQVFRIKWQKLTEEFYKLLEEQIKSIFNNQRPTIK